MQEPCAAHHAFRRVVAEGEVTNFYNFTT
jgi:hypothetical protein